MNPSREKLSRKFVEISQRFWAIHQDLRALERYCELDCDRQAIDRIEIDLIWAMENATVISLHMVGGCLENTMGFEY